MYNNSLAGAPTSCLGACCFKGDNMKLTKKKAFPLGFDCKGAGAYCFHEGMDLRDYFAAKAMQALIASNKNEYKSYAETAKESYKYSDYMMIVR
jgi:hypothetical protein